MKTDGFVFSNLAQDHWSTALLEMQQHRFRIFVELDHGAIWQFFF